MNVCFNDKTLSEICVQSKPELEYLLKSRYNGSVLLSEPESHSKYYLLSINDGSGVRSLGVGLMMICDMPYSITLIPSNDSILIGYNMNLALINSATGKILFDIQLDSYFYYAKVYQSTIFVLSEMSAYLFSYTGERINQIVFDDVLESYRFDGECFEYKSNEVVKKISLQRFGVS